MHLTYTETYINPRMGTPTPQKSKSTTQHRTRIPIFLFLLAVLLLTALLGQSYPPHRRPPAKNARWRPRHSQMALVTIRPPPCCVLAIFINLVILCTQLSLMHTSTLPSSSMSHRTLCYIFVLWRDHACIITLELTNRMLITQINKI
jgi:hypothetical protein